MQEDSDANAGPKHRTYPNDWSDMRLLSETLLLISSLFIPCTLSHVDALHSLSNFSDIRRLFFPKYHSQAPQAMRTTRPNLTPVDDFHSRHRRQRSIYDKSGNASTIRATAALSSSGCAKLTLFAGGEVVVGCTVGLIGFGEEAFGVMTCCSGEGRPRLSDGRVECLGAGGLDSWNAAGEIGLAGSRAGCELIEDFGVCLDWAETGGVGGGGSWNEADDDVLDVIGPDGVDGVGIWKADVGDPVLEGPLRAGDCNGVSKSNSGLEVVVEGMAGSVGVMGAKDGVSFVSKAEKFHIPAEGSGGCSCAFVVTSSCSSFDAAATSVASVSLEVAGEVSFMAGSSTELFTPMSKIPLAGRLLPTGEATDGEATISPHSSSSSSSTSAFEPTDGAEGGGTSCREDLLSGSGALAVTPVLPSNLDAGTSSDCLTARLGGLEEAGVADPLVMVLQPKAGLFGGPGMLSGDGDGRLLTPGDRGGKLFSPVDKLREWVAADLGCRDRGRGTVAEAGFGGCALFLLPKI